MTFKHSTIMPWKRDPLWIPYTTFTPFDSSNPDQTVQPFFWYTLPFYATLDNNDVLMFAGQYYYPRGFSGEGDIMGILALALFRVSAEDFSIDGTPWLHINTLMNFNSALSINMSPSSRTDGKVQSLTILSPFKYNHVPYYGSSSLVSATDFYGWEPTLIPEVFFENYAEDFKGRTIVQYTDYVEENDSNLRYLPTEKHGITATMVEEFLDTYFGNGYFGSGCKQPKERGGDIVGGYQMVDLRGVDLETRGVYNIEGIYELIEGTNKSIKLVGLQKGGREWDMFVNPSIEKDGSFMFTNVYGSVIKISAADIVTVE